MGLFDATPIAGQTAPYSSTTQTSLPSWYTNPVMQLLADKQAVSARPLQLFQGPRVADFTPGQRQGFSMTGEAAGAYRPGLDAAFGATRGALAGPTGASVAQPYFARAAQTAPSNVAEYMNPYDDAVVKRIGELGNRNLVENILPGISDRFTGGGSFGGTRQAELFGRGVREAQEGISAEQARALQQGYTGALSAAQTDLARTGALGTSAAGITNNDTQNQITAGAQLGNLGAASQTLGLRGADAVTATGAAQQGLNQQNLDTAYADFLRQQGYPQEQIDSMLGTIIAAAPAVPKLIQEAGVKPTGTNQTFAPSGFQQGLSGLATAAGALKTLGAFGGP